MATQPSFIPSAFAASGDKNTIPASDNNTGAASYAAGFPPKTALPLSAGGVAPDRKDFNGILNTLSLFALFQQSGGTFAYSNTQDYSKGAVVTDGSGGIYVAILANGPGTTAGVKALTNHSYWHKLMDDAATFTGATSGSAGAAGLVPAPSAGQQSKTLLGDGSWGQDPDVTAAKAAGQIGYAKNVTEAVDLDTYQTPGIYYLVWNNGDTNFPVSGVGGYMQVISGSGSVLTRQVFFTNYAAKAETYTRLYNNGEWKSWTKYINYSDTFAGATSGYAGTRGIVPAPSAGAQGKTLMGDGTWGQDPDVSSAKSAGQIGPSVNIPSGETADLDTYTTAGHYCFRKGAILSNAPNNLPYGQLTVVNTVNTYPVAQTFVYNPDNVYVRTKASSGGAWTSWARIINDTDFAAFTGATAGAAGTAGIVPAPAAGEQGKTLMGDGTWGQDAAVTSGLAVGELGGYINIAGAADMNDYETPGLHVYFTSSPSHQNWPSGAMSGANYLGGHMFVMRSGTASIVRQIFIPYLSARVDIYSRMKSSGGTWGSWALISSSGNVPGVNTAPIPTNDDGIGKWRGINSQNTDVDFSASSFDLPSGGTWAYMVIRAIDGAGVSDGVGGCFVGIGAGGATISPTYDTNYNTNAWRGLAWRIA